MQIIYLKTKTPISIGDKIKIDNVTITITQQFIDDNNDMFEVVDNIPKYVKFDNEIFKVKDWTSHSYCKLERNEWDSSNCILEPFKHLVTSSTEKEYLLQIAKEKYPVGTKFTWRDVGMAWISTGEFYFSEQGISTGSIFVYKNNEWAEVLKPILTTEDGVELYAGDEYWFCEITGHRWIPSQWLIPYYVKRCARLEEGVSISTATKFFSTEEACQEYIDECKEKTLEDYEFELSMQHNNSDIAKSVAADFIQEMKNAYPELYWYKIALLIKDDLNSDWKTDCAYQKQRKYYIFKHEDKINVIWRGDGLDWPLDFLYFRSKEVAEKFIELIGDKIDYLFGYEEVAQKFLKK